MPVHRHTLLASEDLHLTDVNCAQPPHAWTEPRQATVFGLVLVRRGLVLARVDGVVRTMDPNTVFVERHGTEQQFAHPEGGDRYTEIVASAPLVAGVLGGDPTVPEGFTLSTPALALAHRLLLRRAGAGADAFELAERTVALTGTLLAAIAPRRADAAASRAKAARTRLGDDARAALAHDWRLGLTELGQRLGCSPYHLSRTFRAATGVTLSEYRTRLRIAAALERLLDGEDDLAALAVETGFADQAHLTHVLRNRTGLPPGRLRALLGRPGPRRGAARGRAV